MDISSILLAVVVLLAATAISILLFERLGFGFILGFIVAGIIVGPHIPGHLPVHAVEELQSVAEPGVALFLFTVGLEMRPGKVWAMRPTDLRLGSTQMLLTAALLSSYLMFVVHATWETATVVGLASGMTSTTIVMATLGERGGLASEHGRTTFVARTARR